MRANVLALHFSRGTEIVVAVTEADEPKPLTFLCALVANDSSFLHRRKLGERFEEGIVGYLACKVTHEESEMCRVPFKESGIGPSLTTTRTHNGLGILLRAPGGRGGCVGCRCTG